MLSADNDTLTPGLYNPGPRVVNFADILKYDYIPLASTLKKVLEVTREAFGAPVEIEFAVDLTKDDDERHRSTCCRSSRLSAAAQDIPLTLKVSLLMTCSLYPRKSMGNGLVEDITDLIYVEPDKFDNLKTAEMADEIDAINRKMML